MKPISETLRKRISLGAAIVVLMSLCLTGGALAMYLTDATRPDGLAYRNPDDGMCVVGVAPDGTMKIDASITNARDCVAYTTGLTGMTTAVQCTLANGTAPNDGYKHSWATSNVCINSATPTVGIPLTDLDRTAAMCVSKGGTGFSTGICVAYGWVYRNRLASGDLPVSGTGVFTTDGVTTSDDLGFCYASMDMTSATYVDRDTCPSEHNNNPPAAVNVCKDSAQATIAACQIVANHAWSVPLGACVDTSKTTVATCTGGTFSWVTLVSAGVAPAGEWAACPSNAIFGCQTQLAYDAGLGWSLPDSGAVSTSTGAPSSSAVRVCQDTDKLTKVDCEAANNGSKVPGDFYWNPDLSICVDSSKTTSGASLTCKNTAGPPARNLSIVIWADNNRCIYQYGQKGKLAAAVLPVNAYTRVGEGTVVDLTTYANQGDCLAAGYAWDNWLPNINRTNLTGGGLPAGAQIVKLDATTLVKDGGGNFASGTGAVCTKCHTDQSRAYIERQKPGYIETRHKFAGDSIGPWQTNFTAANSDWGIKGVQCEICHSTARAAQDDLIQVVPAGVVGPPAAGAPISATGHNKTEYGGHVTDVCFHCHGNFPSGNAGNVVPANGTDWVLTPKGLAPIGNQFLNSPHAKYTGSSSKVDIGNKTKFASTFIGYLCRSAAGMGNGSIITTMFQSGVAKRIPFLDSLINLDCTNVGDGTANSGAAGFWVREGDVISPVPAAGSPLDSSQGNCMTCHDMHWALASTNPEAEPIRRECTTCHENSGTSASGAPQVNLATINHQSGVGTPLEHMATEPAEACEICHMPRSSPAGSFMHLWRINTSATYTTMGATEANTAADGSYTSAAWVDLDHACGQCHGGGPAQGPGYEPVPPALYRTRATLADVANGMHASSGLNYSVTFSTTINALNVGVNASVDCGGVYDHNDPDAVDPTCPPFTYDWNWGDATAHGTLDPDSHTYLAAGKYEITLIVKTGGLQVGAPVTQGVTLVAPDLPPVAAGACTWDANSWTMTVVDSSTDAPNPPPHVVVDWGDGGAKSSVVAGGTVLKTYTRVGAFTVKLTATDTLGQSNTVNCSGTNPAVPAYFSIDGTVRTNGGGAVVPGALVTLKKRLPNGTYSAIASTTTSATGTYSFGTLKPARYSITVTKTGFVFPVKTTSTGPSQTVDVNATSPLAVMGPSSEETENAN